MSSDRWLSVNTVVENGKVHVLQQKVDVLYRSNSHGTELHRSNEHRLVPLDELEGIRPNDTDEEGTEERPDGFEMVDLT